LGASACRDLAEQFGDPVHQHLHQLRLKLGPDEAAECRLAQERLGQSEQGCDHRQGDAGNGGSVFHG
jgi:hypothetical protein